MLGSLILILLVMCLGKGFGVEIWRGVGNLEFELINFLV